MDKIAIVLPGGFSIYTMDKRLLDDYHIYLDDVECIDLNIVVYMFIFNMIYVYNYIKDTRKYIKTFKIERGN